MQILVSLVVIAVALSILSLLVSIGSATRVLRLERRLAPTGLPSGSAVPREALSSLVDPHDLEAWLRGPSLVVFASPNCGPCRDLIRVLNERAPGSGLRILVAAPSEAELEVMKPIARFSAAWGADENHRARTDFQTDAMPHSFLIANSHVVQQFVGPNIQVLLDASPADLLSA